MGSGFELGDLGQLAKEVEGCSGVKVVKNQR